MLLLLRRQAELPEIAHVSEQYVSTKRKKSPGGKTRYDPEFGKQLEQEENIDKRVEIMKDAGFDFTKEEFRQAVMEMSSDSGELSDDDLAAVAGGKSGDLGRGRHWRCGPGLLVLRPGLGCRGFLSPVVHLCLLMASSQWLREDAFSADDRGSITTRKFIEYQHVF